MNRSHALVLCASCWSFSQCVKEGPVLWQDVAGTSPELTSSTSIAVSTTTGPPPADETRSGSSVDARTSGDSSGSQDATSSSDVTSTDATDGGSTGTLASDGGSSETAMECIVTRGGDGITLIDDLEDGDILLPDRDGRSGWWYTATDRTPGEHFPPVPWAPSEADAFAGSFAAHFSGSGFLDWGATLGFTLNEECPYDASAYSGITFQARGQGTIRVRFTTVATVPTVLVPGDCVEACWDDFATDIDLTESWEEYRISWSDLAQAGWGEPAEFDPAELLAIVWQGGTAMSTFDLWLDEIAFVVGEDSA